MSAAPRIEVVVAVIVRDDRILLTQRRGDVPGPWLWECPGGKIELDENHETALRREVFEELGLTFGVGVALCRLTCDPPETTYPVEVTFYVVGSVVGTPTALAAAGMGWFAIEELAHMTQTSANRKARALLELYMLRRESVEPE